ncbi:flagellar biosynthesis protein FlgA [Anoxybacter fermentans]|uniref:Flagellar P-ring protein n=1 Tax=Anoxybacter fermentans TaxID=1323375 RepID=A0A3Q9HR88_9FIRM|nr:flagellar basal body P-ring protein FlgI [Anoxybacter fermentans]AZR73847.1 flagellar biosynthesis protein FlgA [Anoxybacter fermentans]
MNKKLLIIFILVGLIFTCIPEINAASIEDPMVYIRDLTRIDGVRNNMLMGIGLVIGLDGTGDSRFSPTFQMLKNLLNQYGIITDPSQARAKNVAAVMVTATLPPFARAGDQLDVTVSSIGDAKSLQGGTLLLTALKAPNGQIYAAAQGPISVGGFGAKSGGSSMQQNHLQVGRIPNGAIVEQTLEPDLNDKTEIDFLLHAANFETAHLIAQTINEHFRFLDKKVKLAKAINAGRVRVKVPIEYRNDVVNFVAQIQGLQVRASMPAKVVINERTGTIVIGHNVRISTVAVAHGNLTVTISTQEETTQTIDEAGNTWIETGTGVQINVEEKGEQLVELKTGATIGDVVKALNAIGASPRDIIAILQAMKEAGALYAQIELI